MEKNTYLIGLDLGTTMLKCSAIGCDGRVHASGKVQTEYLYGDNHTVEFDIDRFYDKVAALIKSVLAQLPEGYAVGGLASASASGNTLLLDEDGRPMGNTISWLDHRDQGEAEQVLQGIDLTQVRDIAGWGGYKNFPIGHLCWYRVHQPELLDSAAHICMSTDYLLYRMTGRLAMDHSTATTFRLQDQKNRTWYKPFLDCLKIRESQLPELCAPGTLIGTVTEKASAETGLPVGTPVSLGAFDHPCAARGSGVLHEGEMMLSCGTSWVGFYPVKDRRKGLELSLLIDPFLAPEGCWGMMFSLSSVAEQINYYIETFIDNTAERFALLDRYALSGVPGAHGLKIDLDHPNPAIANAPMEDRARALVEAVAARLTASMERLKQSGVGAESIKMVGGPSESECWPKLLSEIMGMPVTVVNGSYSGAVGAAILGGIGGGLFADLEDAYRQLGIR